jgi:hypothetical protein
LAGVIVVASIIITMQQPKPKKAQNPAKANTEQPAQSNQKSK